MFRGMQLLARVPGALPAFLAPLRLRPVRGLPLAFGWLRKRPIEPEVSDAYLNPYFAHAGVRRDLRKLLKGISTRYTLDAAAKLQGFRKPALVVWATEDKVFPVEHGHRLGDILDARVVEVPDSYSFVPEDQPERLAELIADFARVRATA
jgi:pimeloyl-ACP methyl ester carboxylesterase